MNLFNLIKLAYVSIFRNTLRSFLTMLGIIIGVASVIAMLAIGKGSDESIKAEVASLGTNVLMINPGSSAAGGVRQEAGSSQVLKPEDAAAVLKYCPSVTHVSPVVQNRVQAVAGTRNWRTTVYGVHRDYFRIRNIRSESGMLFSGPQGQTMHKICLVGKTVAENLFPGSSSPVGQTVRLNNIPFKVIGVLAPKGQGSFGQDQDDVILAPFPTVQKRVLGVDYLNQIMVSARSEAYMEQAQAEIEQVLSQKQRRVSGGENQFTVRSQAEISSVLGSISRILTILLASIACISLLVGGIGIMNIMLVSVTERTREIGLRLAVGATESIVLLQFLTEAVLLSLTGGLIGIGIGFLTATVAGALMQWPVMVTPDSAAMAFLFSTTIGVFFGYYPARKASQLNPIEALRYE